MSTAPEKMEAVNTEEKGAETGGGQLNNSVIGRENGFSGEFHSNGLLRIDGDFKGIIKGFGTVLIGEKGRIVGDIYAKSVRIGGKIKGNVYALDRIDVLATGKVIGDLITHRCFAEEGMHFTGNGRFLTDKELDSIFDRNVKNIGQIINEDF
jgi:cytoskeletal protein CcmA (bactofilin family)